MNKENSVAVIKEILSQVSQMVHVTFHYERNPVASVTDDAHDVSL